MPAAPFEVAFQDLGARRVLAYLWHERPCSEAMLDRTVGRISALNHLASFVASLRGGSGAPAAPDRDSESVGSDRREKEISTPPDIWCRCEGLRFCRKGQPTSGHRHLAGQRLAPFWTVLVRP